MQEHLNRMRNAWADRLAAQVCHKLRPEMRSPDMLASWVEDDQLALAAVLARIAAEDIGGSSPQIISERLRAAGMVLSRTPASLVADDLVMPVLRTVRRSGVPWKRWWDIRGLSELLVELWTGRRLATHPRERVRHELATLWRVPSQLMEVMLENVADPFTCLPSDFLSESATGVAKNFMHTLIAMGKISVTFDEDILRSWPQLEDRPDLVKIVRCLCRRNDLERAVRRVSVPPELKDDFRSDLETWDARMRQLIFRLTSYEGALIMPSTEDDRYGEKCLLDGQGFYQARVLGDDALLWNALNVPDSSTPEWMVDEIVTCGTRFFHVQVGPHPVWLATAETDSHLAGMQALIAPSAQYGFGVEDIGDGVRLWLQFPASPGDLGPGLQAPYTYSLSWVEHAWELLHLATAGYVRLCVVSLVGDGELRAVGSVWLKLPEEVCARSKQMAVMALRRLVGNETWTIKQRIATEGNDQSAAVAFRSCENAKGEDVHDEVVLVSNFSECRRFVSASRHLARVRAGYAARLLDGKGTEGGGAQMKLAEEGRQRALELLRGASDWGEGQEESSRSTFSLDGQTLFVHLINRFGRFQLAAGWGGPDRTHFELFTSEKFSVDNLAKMARDWARYSPDGPGREWHDHLRQLLSACAELAQFITEVTARYQCSRLILSPMPPMELLPLHAAPLNAAHSATLNDAFDHVAYAPTARLVSAIQRSSRRAAEVEVLVVAHSGAGIPGIDPISGPTAEANLIANLCNGAEVLSGEDATPTQALEAMSKARIVHVASHGLTHPNRWAAGLALQGHSLGQAVLTTSRILADGAFSSVDLVILNACRTGTHESTTLAVQTLRSLESAFLARGARAVISTLWEITDLQGLVFSTVLHAHLSVSSAPHTAYRDTIRYLCTHQWRVTSRHEPVMSAESLMSAMLPDWRSHLDEQAAENPLFWAAFKITGAV